MPDLHCVCLLGVDSKMDSTTRADLARSLKARLSAKSAEGGASSTSPLKFKPLPPSLPSHSTETPDSPHSHQTPNSPLISQTPLFGKLREHELEMNRLNVQESKDKHVRNIALKAVKDKGKQESSDDSDEENLSLLSRKFRKFLKRNRNKDNKKDRYGNKKSNDFNSNNYTCFGCGEQGHIKADCTNKESKEKKSSYKEKKGKSKRAYIAWDENEVSSSSSSSSEEERENICLIAEEDD